MSNLENKLKKIINKFNGLDKENAYIEIKNLSQKYKKNLKVQNILSRGGLVCFYMAEWTEHLEKMKKDCPKIFEFAVEESGALFDTYPPKDIKLRR